MDGITFTNIYQTASGCFALQSHTYSIFNQFYDMFYIDNSRTVPNNIELTPIILRQWYISDGSITTNGGIYIAKATNVEMLLNKLRDTLNINVTYHYDKKRNYGKFYIPKKDAVKFLNYIGNCPVKCYEYKWDI